MVRRAGLLPTPFNFSQDRSKSGAHASFRDSEDSFERETSKEVTSELVSKQSALGADAIALDSFNGADAFAFDSRDGETEASR